MCKHTPISYILLYIVFINSCLNKHSPDSITLYPWRRQHHHIWQSTHLRSAIGTCSLTSTHWHSLGTCSSHPCPPKACWWKGWWIKGVGEFTLSWWIWTITDMGDNNNNVPPQQSLCTPLFRNHPTLLENLWANTKVRCPLSINHSNHVLGKA